MRIGGFQRLSLIDFPRTLAAVVFTQGCQFRCDYCHNPELVLPPSYGPLLPEDEIFKFLEKRQGKLGGVVVTGGEPTIQPDLVDFLGRVKALGFQVKLDTSGINPRIIHTLLEQQVVDYIAMDLKAPLDRYAAIVHYDVDPETIKESIHSIMQSGVEYEFRTTVVDSLLSPADIIEMAKLIRGAQRYVLQPFSPTKTNNPAFFSATTYSSDIFDMLISQLEQYVHTCWVRS